MIFVGVCSKFAKLFFVAKLKGLRAFSSNICEIEIKWQKTRKKTKKSEKKRKKRKKNAFFQSKWLFWRKNVTFLSFRCIIGQVWIKLYLSPTIFGHLNAFWASFEMPSNFVPWDTKFWQIWDNDQTLVKNDFFWGSPQVRTTFSGAKLIALTVLSKKLIISAGNSG